MSEGFQSVIVPTLSFILIISKVSVLLYATINHIFDGEFQYFKSRDEQDAYENRRKDIVAVIRSYVQKSF